MPRLLQARVLVVLASEMEMDYLLKRIVDEGGDPALLNLTTAEPSEP